MSNKKSFILHLDNLDVLDDMSESEIAALFLACRDYNNGKEPLIPDSIKYMFKLMKNQFDRDTEKYKKTCETRAKSGSKGGKQKVANASKSKQKVAKVADNDSDNVNDSVSDNEKLPTVDDFEKFAVETAVKYKKNINQAVSAARSGHAAFSANNWCDSKGSKVINWKSKLLNGWLSLEKLQDNIVDVKKARERLKAYSGHLWNNDNIIKDYNNKEYMDKVPTDVAEAFQIVVQTINQQQ